MTIIEQIRAEIERRQKENFKQEGQFAAGRVVEDADILSFLSTLESKKPMNQEVAVKYKNSVINSLRKKRVFPTLKGEQLHKFKNEVNTLKQILQPWQTYGNIQSELFEQFALAFAVWGSYNLNFRVQDSELEDSRDSQNKEGRGSSETQNDLEKSEKPTQEGLEEEIRSYADYCEFDFKSWDYDTLDAVARHFAQWGAEHPKK